MRYEVECSRCGGHIGFMYISPDSIFDQREAGCYAEPWDHTVSRLTYSGDVEMDFICDKCRHEDYMAEWGRFVNEAITRVEKRRKWESENKELDEFLDSFKKR